MTLKGGRREGAGRPPTGMITLTIRVSREQRDAIHKNGGSQFIRDLIDQYLKAQKEKENDRSTENSN
ncbi:MAG: hypothetical protein Q4E62_03985 [Sutterellaceae bacterium]|nr:hypothetical protein [Sutterellaceae bacterium]